MFDIFGLRNYVVGIGRNWNWINGNDNQVVGISGEAILGVIVIVVGYLIARAMYNG